MSTLSSTLTSHAAPAAQIIVGIIHDNKGATIGKIAFCSRTLYVSYNIPRCAWFEKRVICKVIHQSDSKKMIANNKNGSGAISLRFAQHTAKGWGPQKAGDHYLMLKAQRRNALGNQLPLRGPPGTCPTAPSRGPSRFASCRSIFIWSPHSQRTKPTQSSRGLQKITIVCYAIFYHGRCLHPDKVPFLLPSTIDHPYFT